MPEKVVLAHTGGLRSSACIHWLRHQRNLRVVALIPDLGGPEDLEALAESAIEAGASGARIRDLRAEYAHDYILPALASGAVPHLANALGRLPLAAELVRLAREEGCRNVTLGGPITGGDTERFDRAIRAQADDVEPWSQDDWELAGHDALLSYARRHGLAVSPAAAAGLTRDANLWGARTRAPRTSPWDRPPVMAPAMTRDAHDAPTAAVELDLFFDGCRPVAVDGTALNLVDLIARLNALGGEHGVGRLDDIAGCDPAVIEIFEAPAAVLLRRAQQALMDIYLTRTDGHFVRRLAHRYAEMVLDGRWESRLRAALDACFAELLAALRGRVRLRLYRGSFSLIGRELA